MLLQGLIDVEKEVAKLMTKKSDLEKQMEKLREKMAKSDYKEKVPVKVQEQDAEKVRKGNWRCFLGCEDLNFLINNNCHLSSATSEPNRTWKSKRSHGQLQENDVTFSSALNDPGSISTLFIFVIIFML